uniref:Uncharacterized protein n=1 Tax=Anopheles minimus TaxID=112268 RepID=A0A182WMU5_9DIPT
MPRTGTSSPSMRRTEHSDRENSDEEDVLLPNVRDGLNNAEPGMDEYSEGKNESDHSFTEGKSSSSDGDSSFVGKIRSNFSGMISALLPARQSKQSGGLPPARKPSERRFEARNIGNEQFEGQSSIDLRKRPLSPNLVEIDVDNRTYETIKKRPRLRESADTKEEERSIRPTSATLGTQTASSSSSHRLSGLMSNATYRRRMQQSRGGYVHKTLFGSSHLKSTKNRNDSVASSGRPSFNISVAKMAKTLSNGWIPPEYGGSPFYEGLTRFGGASSAHTLATPGPSRPPVTVLVKKSHPTVKAQSLPDPLEEFKPETHASAMSYSSRRILEIVNEYSARSSSSKRGMSLSNVDLRTPRTLQMLNLIRSQQMERSEEPPEQPARPPTVPLMEYSLPLHVDSSNSPDAPRKEEAKSSGGKQITKKTRLHADPIKERDDSTVEPIQLPNLKLPPLEGLPKFDFTVPMKGPLLPADKKGGMNSDKLPESDEKKKGEDKAKDTRTPTSTIRSEIRSFGFTSPMPLASSSKVTDPVTAVVSESSIPLTREVTTFVFTSPKLLNGSSQSANPAPTVSNEAPSLHCEKHTFVFVTPLMLDSPTVHTEPVSATIMSFEFTSPEPLEVIAPKVRSFQELMAESA